MVGAKQIKDPNPGINVRLGELMRACALTYTIVICTVSSIRDKAVTAAPLPVETLLVEYVEIPDSTSVPAGAGGTPGFGMS
jgi:hypothetical protein